MKTFSFAREVVYVETGYIDAETGEEATLILMHADFAPKAAQVDVVDTSPTGIVGHIDLVEVDPPSPLLDGGFYRSLGRVEEEEE